MSEESKPCPHCGEAIPAQQITRWAGQLNAAKRKKAVGGFKDPNRAREAARARWDKQKAPKGEKNP